MNGQDVTANSKQGFEQISHRASASGLSHESKGNDMHSDNPGEYSSNAHANGQCSTNDGGRTAPDHAGDQNNSHHFADEAP